MYLVNYKELMYVRQMYRINQSLVARMVYLFKSYSDFIYEVTGHAADCSGRSTVVRRGLSPIYLLIYIELLYLSCTYKSVFSS